MKPANIIMSWGAQLTIERPVRNLTIDELITQLGQSAKQISEHLEMCSDTPYNRRQLCHMVGIERWAQRRLRVALGEPFLSEEYDHYRPSVEHTWVELKNEWFATRQATLTLASDLVQANPSPEYKIPHNQFGALSIKGWLRYIDVYASSESKRIR